RRRRPTPCTSTRSSAPARRSCPTRTRTRWWSSSRAVAVAWSRRSTATIASCSRRSSSASRRITAGCSSAARRWPTKRSPPASSCPRACTAARAGPEAARSSAASAACASTCSAAPCRATAPCSTRSSADRGRERVRARGRTQYDGLPMPRILLALCLLLASCGERSSPPSEPRADAPPPATLLEEDGELTAADASDGRGRYDRFFVDVAANERVIVTLHSSAFDPVLEVTPPGSGALVNDDFEGDTRRSRIELL